MKPQISEQIRAVNSAVYSAFLRHASIYAAFLRAGIRKRRLCFALSGKIVGLSTGDHSVAAAHIADMHDVNVVFAAGY